MKRCFALFISVFAVAACSSDTNGGSADADTSSTGDTQPDSPGTDTDPQTSDGSDIGSESETSPGTGTGTDTGTETTDACEDELCVWPPANHCEDEATLRVYADLGQCDENDECGYPFEDITCDFGCANGACNECEGENGCESGDYCEDGVCLPCIVDEHCGPSCDDCTAGGQVCSREGTDCVDDASCPDGFAGANCEICVRFVDIAAPMGGSGLSWDQALGDVQSGIDAAAAAAADDVSGTCEVWAAQGTYEIWNSTPETENPKTNTILLKPHVAVYGGFSGMGHEAVREHADPDLYPTILWGYESTSSQNRVYHVVTAQNIAMEEGVVLDGFVITGGLADGPLPSEEPLDDGEVLRHVGGGIINIGASYIIEDCRFVDNAAKGAGALANHEGSAPAVRGCLFDGNVATHFEGGAVQNWGEGSDAVIVNSVFTRNSAKLGGAGIFSTESSPTIMNSSFSQNRTTHRGRAVYVGAEAEVKIANSILYDDHGVELHANEDEGGIAQVEACIIEGGHDGKDVFDVDPLFVGAVNLRLQSGSPAIDAGQEAGAPEDDFDGAPRPAGQGIDIGAFEHQGT